MAGTDARFDSDAFREGILFAMNMGAPEDEDLRVTFKWTPDYEWTNPDKDAGGAPFDWSGSPTATNAPDDVQIPCAVDFSGAGDISIGNAVGDFQTRRGTIIVLDTYWPELTVDGRRADLVSIDQAVYAIKFVAPLALFDVTLYELHIEAYDEA